jgi:predicted ATPase
VIIDRISVPEALARPAEWPFTVPAVKALVEGGIALDAPVTFLVGENGSGKSTIVEALAEAWGLDVRGGGGGFRYSSELEKSLLGEVLRIDRARHSSGMVGRRAKGFFLRAETAIEVFERLDFGPAFTEASHGESFLAAFDGFGDKGLYVLDEPEAALSFTACLTLIGTFKDLQDAGSQVVCATHSPLLTALPGASILELGDHGVRSVSWQDLELVQHWRRFLDSPERYLRHL